MKKILLFAMTLALLSVMACSDNSTGAETKTMTACLATINGANAFCGTFSTVTNYSDALCDSLGSSTMVTTMLTGSEISAVASCPGSAAVSCTFTDTTRGLGSVNASFYGEQEVLGSFYCSQFATSGVME